MNTAAGNKTRLMPAALPGRRGRISDEKPKKPGRVILRLWSYLKRQRFMLIIIFILMLINTGSTMTGAYLLRPIINNYIIPHNIRGLVEMIGLLAGIYISGSIAAIFQNRLMIRVAQKTVFIIRAELFAKLQALPLKYFDSHSHGELMSRFTNDVDTISDSLNTSVLQLFISTISVTGIFILMLCISPLLTMVTLAVVSLMFWVAGRIIKKSRMFFTNQQNAMGTMNGYVEEMITGQKVVTVFCYEQTAAGNFEKINYDLRDKATGAQLFSGIMMPVMQNLNTINFAITATVGGLLAIFSGLDLGGLAAFLQYTRQFGRPVNEISNQYNSLQEALAGAERIFQVMDEIPEKADLPGATALTNTRGNVAFNEVVFGYDPDTVILKKISFSVKQGQKIALVGSTGAGKTTILNLLSRFYDVQSGSITIDGADIRNLQRSSLRRSVAIVLQDTHLFTATVMENIRYGRLEASDEEVIAASTLAGAHSFIQRLPKGYQTRLENDGGNLSQGQRQLLNISRATIANPSMMIMDEATSSIDTRTEQIIQKGMDHLMAGRTSFVIAHRLSTVHNADEIMVLEHGEIVERGSHSDLLKLKGRYYDLYTGQFD